MNNESSTINGPQMADGHPSSLILHPSSAWGLSLTGLAIVVFSIVAISSPGRIDVVDGHTRYEVGRSCVEHGDSIVRDPDAWFAAFPGRNGERYASYRFPQSMVAAVAIVISDLTGPVREIRRHFFFSLSGSVLCAALAVLYACWFHRLGHGRAASLAWAAGGIFYTPTWFYGTTTFDDVLGSLVLCMAIFSAWVLREHRPKCAAVVSGLLLGLAFNCKPPLALFLPVAVAALWDVRRAKHERWLQARIAFLCIAAGVIGYQAYDLWKFPPSTWQRLAEARGEYVALWPGNPLAGFLSLLVSPGMGALWYWPALVVALFGVVAWRRRQRLFAAMTGLSCLAFLTFIGSIRFFSGEPAWGPRYLTPVFALLWIFVPAGAERLGAPKSAALLAASLIIQVAGLSLDTMRFFSGEKESTAGRFLEDAWSYFHF
ncbi:MAG TPA: glycosyltransferase family 39 protein, partial [Pirellulales bacterium]|nr:glycosyltransferase family 39 protein [Pirellulales bacterium]